MGIRNKVILRFQEEIGSFYKKNKRDFPWRETANPYHIVVSEVMLQQTQTYRVLPKYEKFIALFPTFQDLAKAPVRQLLKAWSGLGYNRRALSLKKLAQMIVADYHGQLPTDPKLLDALPGVGPATASAIAAFAFDKPAIFIETNIRRVFIHFFFKDKKEISDRQIISYVKKSLDEKKPREWYFALMDYGAHLGKLKENPNHKSKHYTKQSPFYSSNRRIRGLILKTLLRAPQTKKGLLNKIHVETSRLEHCLRGLLNEGFLDKKLNKYVIQQ